MPRCLLRLGGRLRMTPPLTTTHHDHEGASRKELIAGEISDHSFRFFRNFFTLPISYKYSFFILLRTNFLYLPLLSWFDTCMWSDFVVVGLLVCYLVCCFVQFFYPFCYNFFGSFVGRGRCHVTLLSTNDRPRKDWGGMIQPSLLTRSIHVSEWETRWAEGRREERERVSEREGGKRQEREGSKRERRLEGDGDIVLLYLTIER